MCACVVCVCLVDDRNRRKSKKCGSHPYQDSIPVFALKFSLDQSKKMRSRNNFLTTQQVQCGSIFTTAFGSVPKAIDALQFKKNFSQCSSIFCWCSELEGIKKTDIC